MLAVGVGGDCESVGDSDPFRVETLKELAQGSVFPPTWATLWMSSARKGMTKRMAHSTIGVRTLGYWRPTSGMLVSADARSPW